MESNIFLIMAEEPEVTSLRILFYRPFLLVLLLLHFLTLDGLIVKVGVLMDHLEVALLNFRRIKVDP